jgi:hypothetical protein
MVACRTGPHRALRSVWQLRNHLFHCRPESKAFDDCRIACIISTTKTVAIFKTEPNPNKVLADERSNITWMMLGSE